MVNIILTRHPKEMLPSYAKVISNPHMHDVGYKLHVEVLQYLQSQDIPVVILDAKRYCSIPKNKCESCANLLVSLLKNLCLVG